MVTFEQFMQLQLGSNLGKDFLRAIIIFTFCFLVLKLFKSYLIHIFKKAAKKTKTSADDMILDFLGQIHWPFFVYLSVFIASKTLILPKFINDILKYILVFLSVFYAIKGLQKIVDYVA